MSGNLDNIKHIVVLMLENRSFDQMLGYLRVEGGRKDVNGPDKTKHYNVNSADPQQTQHFVRHTPEYLIKGTNYSFDPTVHIVDPDHSYAGINQQLSTVNNNPNGGFIDNYVKRIARQKLKHFGPTRSEPQRHAPPWFDLPPESIMGYYNGEDLPAFDHLAREYCICNHWYSSLPGETQPNRLYAYFGRSFGAVDNNTIPYYTKDELEHRRTIFELAGMAKKTWNYFYHDVPFLYMFQNHPPFFPDLRKSTRYILPIGSVDAEKGSGFYGKLKDGTLPDLTWIDPNFQARGKITRADDDHAPADVRGGQVLVANIYNALRNSDYWKDTLFIITYDEHGGFYDHVTPQDNPNVDPNRLYPDEAKNSASLSRYGVRVPALVVSPWVKRESASDLVFDHTSIIKTIIQWWWPNTKPPTDMGPWVDKALDLGQLITANHRPDQDCTLIQIDPGFGPNTKRPDVTLSLKTDLQVQLGRLKNILRI